jgi:DNA-binding transcriptional regulator YdaS (Cro superfamily)
MKAIDRAIELAGGLQALADSCGVKYQAVQKWRKNRVPPERAGRIEEVTQGQVTRRDLCPDFPWDTPAVDGEAAERIAVGQG